MTAASPFTEHIPPSLVALPFAKPLTGTHAYLTKNSHLGFGSTVPIWEPGFPVVNRKNALRLPVCLYDEARRSRSTGKERDAETGLDYFGARYMSSPQGRFTSPDPKMFPSDITDPQSWNKFGFTRNNPLRYVDPNGEDFELPNWSEIKENAGRFIAALFQPVSSPEAVTQQPQSGSVTGPGFDDRDAAMQSTQAAGKTLNKLADVYETADPTGVMSLARSAMRGDKAGVAMASLPLGGMVAGEAFRSFGALKTALGPAGENMAWHHIVEQSKAGEFGASAINNTANIVKVTKEVNTAINAYYSSKQAFTGAKTVRQWLAGQSWQAQYKFGLDSVKKALAGQLK